MENTNQIQFEKTEHILVGISPAPSNAKIVQTAAKMARAFNGTFTALYVKTPMAEEMSVEDKERLQKNIRMAKQLGATFATVDGDDVPFQIAEYARLSGVTKIVMGRSVINHKRFFKKPTLIDQLIQTAPNIDIHIIPDGSAHATKHNSNTFEKFNVKSFVKDLLISVLLLLITTLLAFGFSSLGFSDANIITIYFISALASSSITKSKICWFFSPIANVLVFNYLFTEPIFTLFSYNKGYPVTCVVLLLSCLVAGVFSDKIKNQARQSSKSAFRTKVLFDANQLIQKATTDDGILSVTAEQLNKLLKRDILIVSLDGNTTIFGDQTNLDTIPSKNCNEICHWVIENKKKAGKNTENFSYDPYLYLPVKTSETVYCVIAVYIDNKPIDTFEYSVMQSIVGECSLALERNRNASEKEQASVRAQNEQLRANLLRSISHDLRTPLTSISGNASNLVSNNAFFDDQTKLSIYKDIYNDSMWLINLVENLLSVTRLEEDKMNINFTTELIDEVVHEAIKHVYNITASKEIVVDIKEELLLAKMDARLIVQVLINLLDNAIKHTPENSKIFVVAERKDQKIFVSVLDNGNGVSDEQKMRVFDMFYTGATTVADSRRSLGLGLALCKSIITAHGGEITVTDNQPSGAVFTFTLPVGEVEINE